MTISEIQENELSKCSRLIDIPSEYSKPASTQTSKASAEQVVNSVYQAKQ